MAMVESEKCCSLECCSRERYWHEKGIEEKVAKLADSLAYLCNQFLQVAKDVHRLKMHQHGEQGLITSPIQMEDAHEPVILKNPLNQESK